VENGDPAKDVHSSVTHMGALHPKATCSFKLLVPCPSNGFNDGVESNHPNGVSNMS